MPICVQAVQVGDSTIL